MEKLPEAIKFYDESLKIKPDFWQSINNKLWLISKKTIQIYQ